MLKQSFVVNEVFIALVTFHHTVRVFLAPMLKQRRVLLEVQVTLRALISFNLAVRVEMLNERDFLGERFFAFVTSESFFRVRFEVPRVRSILLDKSVAHEASVANF